MARIYYYRMTNIPIKIKEIKKCKCGHIPYLQYDYEKKLIKIICVMCKKIVISKRIEDLDCFFLCDINEPRATIKHINLINECICRWNSESVNTKESLHAKYTI